jgi:hypothetical protein
MLMPILFEFLGLDTREAIDVNSIPTFVAAWFFMLVWEKKLDFRVSSGLNSVDFLTSVDLRKVSV